MHDHIDHAAPEQKAGIAARGDHDALMHMFEEFKAANDQRLDEIESRRGDVLIFRYIKYDI